MKVMKRLVITAAAVAAMAFGAGVTVHVTGSQNDPIFEANVEALADGESSDKGFNTVLKIETSHTLICSGSGDLTCTW